VLCFVNNGLADKTQHRAWAIINIFVKRHRQSYSGAVVSVMSLNRNCWMVDYVVQWLECRSWPANFLSLSYTRLTGDRWSLCG